MCALAAAVLAADSRERRLSCCCCVSGYTRCIYPPLLFRRTLEYVHSLSRGETRLETAGLRFGNFALGTTAQTGTRRGEVVRGRRTKLRFSRGGRLLGMTPTLSDDRQEEGGLCASGCTERKMKGGSFSPSRKKRNSGGRIACLGAVRRFGPYK